jgi:hypothetical protein
MAFVDPNVLLANATVPCLDKCLPPGSQWSILISLAARWGGLPTDTPTLLANAPCFDSCVSPGMQKAILINLGQQIAGI